MNKIFVDKTRCLLINSMLLRSFRAKIVSTACYLINRSPYTTVGFKTLEEHWSEKPTNYEHLRIFRCPAYVYIKQEKP